MKYFVVILFLVIFSGRTYSQIRAFDNSKAIMPWLYNPSAYFTTDFQAYFGYDSRGNSSFTPQSIVAGARMPVFQGRNNRRRLNGIEGMAGIQVLNTSQDVMNDLNVQINFAQQVELNRRLKFAMGIGAGINNRSFDYEAFTYIDQQDPVLINGENYVNFHLNVGFSLIYDNKLFINLANPYLLKSDGINLTEIIVRTGYIFDINEDLELVAALNLDTYNDNLIYGGDITVKIKKMLSILASADTNKYYAGLMLEIKPFALGYTYGRNFEDVINHIASHQITVMSNVRMRR